MKVSFFSLFFACSATILVSLAVFPQECLSFVPTTSSRTRNSTNRNNNKNNLMNNKKRNVNNVNKGQRNSFNFNQKRTNTNKNSKTAIQSSAANGDTSSNTGVVENILKVIDLTLLKRFLIPIANHVPTALTLAYFGVVSSVSMMGMSSFDENTLLSVLSKNIGSTSNTEFSQLFPTLVTPANFVFLVWPFLSVVQLFTVLISSLSSNTKLKISQDNLSALASANLAATSWLLISSQASPGNLPFLSFLVLPLVPILSGYPLRDDGDKGKGGSSSFFQTFGFKVFSSFTTIASFLALAQELQHGGRILPFLFQGKAEVCASVFLSLYYVVVKRTKSTSLVKKVVNAFAIWGIWYKRFMGATDLVGLFKSVSFWGTSFIAFLSIQAFKDD